MNRYHIGYSLFVNGVIASGKTQFVTVDAESINDAIRLFYTEQHPQFDCVIRDVWLLKFDL